MAAHRLRSTRTEAILWFLGFKNGHRPLARLIYPHVAAWFEDPRNLSAYNDVVDLHGLLQESKRPPDATDAELRADTSDSLSLFDRDWLPELTVLQSDREIKSEGATLSERSFRPTLVPAPRTGSPNLDVAAPLAAWRRHWRIARWTAACAATILISIYCASAFFHLGSNVFVTGPGQERLVTLADGSRVTMGGATELRVRFTKDLRTIDLDHGEALFDVAHNPLRPFAVHAGAGTITDVGTEFLVRRYSRYTDRIEVWVTHGIVQVAPLRDLTLPLPFLRSASWTPTRLASGEHMSYTDRGSASVIKRSEPRPAAALVEGTFIYHARPLSEVVEDVQRYTPETITLDSRIGNLSYSGSVVERDVHQWIKGLPQIFPGVKITQQPGRIAISYDPEATYYEAAHLGERP